MARMYPESLEGLDVRSNAERLLFDAFRTQLGDQFSVFHSVAWLSVRQPGATPADGEADFVIAHPALGILVLEVKGGIVGFDASAGWYSIRQDNHKIVGIKNPVDQARRSRFALRDKLRAHPDLRGHGPSLGHAVAFPDGTAGVWQFGPDLPRDIVLLHEHLASLDDWVRRCLMFWAGQERPNPPEAAGIEVLTSLLRKSWVLTGPGLASSLQHEKAEIARFTEEQMRVLDHLSHRRRAAIRGCAGSGKTTLAIEKARRLAAEGFRTLLVCYNNFLVNELKRRLGKLPNLSIYNFHGLCTHYGTLTGRSDRPDWEFNAPGFDENVLPDALAEATQREELLFDAIVVDEGQDFVDTWWIALEMLLRDREGGILYVFYDDNQLVYEHALALPGDVFKFALSTNCRNTLRIHDAVVQFYQSDFQITARGPQGRPPRLRRYGYGQSDLQAVLTGVLATLIYTDRVPARDVAVLGMSGVNAAFMADVQKRPGPFIFVDAFPAGAERVCLTSVRRFKGLESPVVILIVPAGKAYADELLYVGISRACQHLEILIAEDADEAIVDRLQEWVISSDSPEA